ncbi:hypothetical protein OAV85_00550 [Candidatus Nanopelagicales bacterium]|nr:hypothetical protein [Candidatus Nanopelagicales bacterium]
MEETSPRTRPTLSYAAVIAIGVVFDRYVNYLAGGDPVLFGQPASVIATYLYGSLAALVWIFAGPWRLPPRQLRAFGAAMGVAWLIHVLLYRLHGDAFNYTALLYAFFLLMILMKPPDKFEARQAIMAFAWSVAFVLVVTRMLEMAGILAIRSQASGVVAFDEALYFLPLNDLLGIDGRWPGPFGHNGDTAMMGALLIVIAVAFWTRASWVFIGIGGVTLILTNGRASIGAAIVGVIVVLMFTSNSKVARIPSRWRLTVGTGALVVGAVVMFLRPSGLTGRERIWPAFLELWWESPWIGVGGSGFANGNEITQQFGHAHSLYIEELARSGLIGFVAQFVALGIGVFIAARAAGVGYPGPLAVMVAYFVTGITEPRNNWIEPSATWFLLVLMVLAASAHLVNEERNRSPDREEDSLPSSPPA